MVNTAGQARGSYLPGFVFAAQESIGTLAKLPILSYTGNMEICMSTKS